MSASHRTLAATAIALGSAVGIMGLAASIHRLSEAGLHRLDDAVAAGVQALGAAILLWYLATAVVTLTCLGMRAAGVAWVAGERRVSRSGAPLARALLSVGAGVAVVAATVVAPASAATAPGLEVSDDLGWGATQDADEPSPEEPAPAEPTPDEPATAQPTTDEATPTEATDAASSDAGVPTPPSTAPGTSTTRPTTTDPGPAPSVADDDPTPYLVVVGDTLWDIAADHLPASADDADIAASWPDWYELNRAAVGPDPDLIHPGQVLVAPDHHPEEGA